MKPNIEILEDEDYNLEQINIKFFKKSYYKAVLHSSKFPSNCVSGIFIGNKVKNEYVISDCFPLFHTHISIPVIETAFILIDELIKKSKNKPKICGIYYANKRLGDEFKKSGDDFPKILKDIGKKIYENSKFCLITIINNRNIGKKCYTFGTTLDYDEKNWKYYQAVPSFVDVNKKPITVSDLYKDLNDLIVSDKGNEILKDLVDFSQHLENVELDFMNSSLFVI